MSHVPASRDQRITELENHIAAFQATRERNERAVEALHNISLACHGSTSFRHIFDAVSRELRTVFAFDSCSIALCDSTRIETFSSVLMVDEDTVEYAEDVSSGPLTGALVRERVPRLFHDLAAERQQLDVAPNPFGDEQKRSRAWLGVPLLVGQDAVGVISIQSYQAGRYDKADLDLLQRIGNIVAVALENAALDQQQLALSAALAEQVAARTGELATLSAVAAELVLQQPLPALLDRALELILALFKLKGGTLRQLDERGEYLRLLAYRGFTPTYADQAARLPVAGSTQGEVVLNNRPLIVADSLTSYPLLPPEEQHTYVALLSVPLRIGTRVLGTMTLLDETPHAFTETEASLAQAIGNQLAIAIENARLFAERERQINELQALGRISRAASESFNLSKLMRLIYAALQSVVPFDTFTMLVYDHGNQLVSEGITIQGEHEHASHEQPIDQRTAWVLEQRQQRYDANLSSEAGQSTGSWLGVPLLGSSGDAIGMLSIQADRADTFDERSIAFLGSMAAQVALHVQNIQLVQQRERQIRELHAIGEIGQLISASYDFEQMLDGVYHMLGAAATSSVFYLIICEPDSQIVTNAIFIEEGEQVPLDWNGKAPLPGSMTAWIMQNRAPLLFHNVPQQREQLATLGIAPRSIGPETPVRSWVGVPLLAKDGEPIGVVSLQDYAPYRYDQQTVDFLSQVASHVSLGVQKVRLFEDRERQIAENARLFAAEQSAHRTADTLREVAQVLSSSFDTQEVLQLILHELHTVIPYDTASIMLAERDQLRIAAYRGLNTAAYKPGDVLANPQRSGAAQVVQTHQPLRIADTQHSPHWTPTDASAHVRSWLGVPLIARGELLGVLNIDSRDPDCFTARDVEVAQAFASQASVALENARLYEESVTRVEQELEIARRIQSNLFPRVLPQPAGAALAAVCLPARETGGDFYDVVELDGTLLGLLIGDASGKSIQGAMLMSIARSIARSEAYDHQKPDTVMHETNRWITHDVPPRSFVALCYATLDLDRKRLALANAGQITPLRRRADGQIEYLDVSGPTLPLGIRADLPYEMREITLEAGDLIVFLTDGIVEAKNNSGALFGFERLECLVGEHGAAAPLALISRVLDAIHEFMAGAPQHDDMTLLVLRVD